MNCILEIALPVPLRRCFDYLPPEDCATDKLVPGQRLCVPFGRRQLIGILVDIKDRSSVPADALKSAISLLDTTPLLSNDYLTLSQQIAHYYHYPLGEVLHCFLPTALRQGKAANINHPTYWALTSEGLALDVELLKRAPRQKALINLLRAQKKPLPQASLTAKGFTNTQLKSLANKNYIHNPLYHEYATDATSRQEEKLTLNEQQQQALNHIVQHLHHFQCLLLHGITGSGKTEVYLQAIDAVVQQGKSALILVPEIGLTPQTITRFQKRFKGPVVALHSHLNDTERANAWLQASQGLTPIVIGTRSALLTPLPKLGIIIVDEEHDLSFKQQDTLRYSARDMAILRAKYSNIPIVLGSATPSLESLLNVEKEKFKRLNLPNRAGNAHKPHFEILDIRGQKLDEGLSNRLLATIRTHLEAGNQVLLFLNRRGFAPVLFCHHCGWIASCSHCDAHMTYHRQPERLYCHHCANQGKSTTQCPHCQQKAMLPLGVGTQRLEEKLQTLFPDFPILRIDKDTTRTKHGLQKKLACINQGEPHILLGTQMLAKGHHFPHVTLVAILEVDNGLFSVDFRATERLGQLILQVAGRAGRAEKKGTVFLQTHQPHHELFHDLIHKDYDYFAKKILLERKQAHLPPYGHTALLRADAKQRHEAWHFLEEAKRLAASLRTSVQILGPAPAPMEKRADRYRAQLFLQSQRRPLLHAFLTHWLAKLEKLQKNRAVRWSLDVDPQEMC